MSVLDVLAGRFATYDRLPDEEKEIVDDGRFLPVPELRRLLLAHWAEDVPNVAVPLPGTVAPRDIPLGIILGAVA